MFEKAARAMLEVVTACACAGIVIGMLSLSGMGLQLSNVLTSLAGGNLLVLLLLTMVVSLILGMGSPPQPATSSLPSWLLRP